jgi:uncharacterized OsmC-like protein
MDAEKLRAAQGPLKARYKEDPEAARLTLSARGTVSASDIAVRIDSGVARVQAGLHPYTGGDGSFACSGDMLLEALVGCAGVTMKAVATAMGIALRNASVHAEGDLDFRGTLGVAKDAPVGFAAVRLRFDVESDATEDQLKKLVELTERYCVVYQTLKNGTPITGTLNRRS